ncbi:MAG: RsmB/NOP family class I SAM-dependent RNA methyltransferase [Verrucomicrobia bacterium]|nr:RsmB/NOP family class I SAM-dependent RNA methyltransferase [Verrucomicrobiota bacterium]
MLDEIKQIAARCIRGADQNHPADAVLREELRAARRLPPEATREVARLVFDFYRWRGWLDSQDSPDNLERQLQNTARLAVRFAREPDSFPDEELARAVPEWIGDEMEVTPDWLRTLQAEPKLWLRAKRGTGRALSEKLGECVVPSEPALADAIQYFGREDLFRAPEFHAGEFEIQDVSSQAVGLACDPQPGETWWDACAGEGGKMLHLSDLMQNKGLIWASDRAEWRLKKLKQRTARAKCFNYRAAPWDGGAKLPTKTKFDGILVDAPCSGLGTWGRNPHARWTTTPTDIRELAEIQNHLLAHVAPALKPGGRLIYSVCTLARRETVEVAENFSRTHSSFEPLPLKNPFAPSAPPENLLTLWPQQTDGNGMFIAAWRAGK